MQYLIMEVHYFSPSACTADIIMRREGRRIIYGVEKFPSARQGISTAAS